MVEPLSIRYRILMNLSALRRTLTAVFICLIGVSTAAVAQAKADYQLFARTNLVAWCIVPFDAKKRGPEERAAMLEQLGFKMFAYDYRAQHIPTFDTEMDALQRHHVQLTAWWFPTVLNEEAKQILALLKRRRIQTQLWVMGGGDIRATPEQHAALVESESLRIKSIAEEAAKIGCSVALYNHDNWFGEPENQIAIIEKLRPQGITNVTIVYNLHHGHDHVDRFAALLQKMKPHLSVVNINGMVRDGNKNGKLILPIGQGDLELTMLKQIVASGWRGPIGILNHTDEDAEGRLLDNLEGLDWLAPQITGRPAGKKPQPRTWRDPGSSAQPPAAHGKASLAPAFGTALNGGMVVKGKVSYRTRPLTIECFAKLNSKQGFNILVASDPKNSAEHWELYSYAGNGAFSVYQPGRGGEFKSDVNICDGQWHHLAAILEPDRGRLFVDAKLVLDQAATPLTGEVVPGDLAFGQLIDGSVGVDGLVDEVRISRGAREIATVPKQPFAKDDKTIGLWHFDDLKAEAKTNSPYWIVEDPAEREKLPLYKTIPAAKPRSKSTRLNSSHG